MNEMLGLYPQWYVPGIGTAWVMGIIGTIHVLASHTSVGAAWLFALLATKSVHENKPEIMVYLKKYGMFLLVFSYIIGSITGPGIWYSVTVASPRGISGLIHNFVWLWASEWVFFFVEVIGVYAMVYLIGKIDNKTYLKLAWSFAVASWATMILIVPILSFMMWPGNDHWFQTGSTFDAAFNLNYFAHLGVRTAFMFAVAGAVGGIIASTLKDRETRIEITRFLSKMGLAGLVLMSFMFMWYTLTLPDNARLIMDTQMMPRYGKVLLVLLTTTALYFMFTAWKPLQLRQSMAGAMTLAIALFGLWPEERSRESMRKPYVAGQYIYSNQFFSRDVPGKGVKSDMPLIKAKGVLATDYFVPADLHTITPENQLRAGSLLTHVMCANCHSLEPNGALRPLPALFGYSKEPKMIKAYLDGALYHGMVPYMPKMPLPEVEREAMAVYIASLPGGSKKPASVAINQTEIEAKGVN
ncbi:c-type cytochrome [Halothiobacillus sp.]|uniref:c-type cytochrome n=1 Tax=Halothiobacillus sp. TaxID=1891311 RepID=UPI003D0C07D5